VKRLQIPCLFPLGLGDCPCDFASCLRTCKVHNVDGDEVMKRLLPDKMARLKALYKEVGMVK
jgi:hypothetical protein